MHTYLLHWIIALVLLTPAWGLVRLELFLLALWFMHITLRLLAGHAVRLAVSPYALGGFTALAFSMLLSIAWGAWLGYAAAYGDIIQLLRLATAVGLYLFTTTVINTAPDPVFVRQRLLKIVVGSALVLALLVFQQYFDWGHINRLYVPLVAPTHTKGIVDHMRPRPVGMVGNPNPLAFLYALVALCTIHLARTTSTPWRWLAALAVCVSCLGLTLSRSGLLTLTLGLVVLVPTGIVRRGLRLAKRPLRIAVLVTCLCGGIVAAALLSTGLSAAVTWRFATLADLDRDESWRERVRSWDTNLRMFRASPVLGVGPLRRIDFGPGHSEWLQLLRSYGVVGTALLVLTYGLPFLGHPLPPLVRAVGACTGLAMSAVAVWHNAPLLALTTILLAAHDPSCHVITVARPRRR